MAENTIFGTSQKLAKNSQKMAVFQNPEKGLNSHFSYTQFPIKTEKNPLRLAKNKKLNRGVCAPLRDFLFLLPLHSCTILNCPALTPRLSFFGFSKFQKSHTRSEVSGKS